MCVASKSAAQDWALGLMSELSSQSPASNNSYPEKAFSVHLS